MKHLRLFLVLVICFLLFHSKAPAQSTSEVSRLAYAEKIYLQFSNLVCSTNETLWFKAIVARAADNRLTDLSKVLYVELIDFDERVVDKKKLKLENGIGNGFFLFKKGYQPGRYLVRAYTEWNKNFGEDFIFSEYIELTRPEIVKDSDKAIKNIVLTEMEGDSLRLSATIQPRVIDPNFRGKLKLFIETDDFKDSIVLKKNNKRMYEVDYPVSKKTYQAKLKLALEGIKLKNHKVAFVNSFSRTVIIDENKLDIQFFPEGGQFVHGLENVMAFKAINFIGNGVSVSGDIVNSKGEIVSKFKSNHLGMGTVILKGNANDEYIAKVLVEGTEYRYPLPKASPAGYALKVVSSGKNIRIHVRSIHTKSKRLYINVESRGVRYHRFELDHTNFLSKATISEDVLPEGIVKITVFDEQQIPVCERLIFNTVESNRLVGTITANANVYSQRDKAVLSVSAKNMDKAPEIANASILVLNKDISGSENVRPNILSYFLLNSELKGAIEHPNYYFDTDNITRTRDLDALMLTQGWRSYKYNAFDKDKEFRYAPERGLYVSGAIGELLKTTHRKKKKEVDLTLMAFGEPNEIFTKKVDSTGKFRFDIGDMYKNELELLFQTNNQKGKKRDYTINIHKQTSPGIAYEEKTAVLTADTLIQKQYVNKLRDQKSLENQFDLNDNIIQLDEVELTDYKLTPERQKIMDEHGSPDIVIEDKELHAEIKKWSYGLYSVLMFSFPDDINIVRQFDPETGQPYLFARVHNADYTYYIIDGIAIHEDLYRLLPDLPTEEIKSVEILSNPKNRSKYFIEVGRDPLGESPGFDSFIVIYTYAGKGLFGVQRTRGIDKKIIQGFSPLKEFYIPKYDASNEDDWNVPDLRSVVYWNPNIATDEEGKSSVEYYNGDDIGEMLVIMEAITEDGKIGYNQFTYSVEENLTK